jgi:hypothetical protein
MEIDPVTAPNAGIPAEMRELIRELTSDEINAVTGGCRSSEPTTVRSAEVHVGPVNPGDPPPPPTNTLHLVATTLKL